MTDDTSDEQQRTDEKQQDTVFQDIFHAASERIARLDDQGLILSVNSRFANLFNYEQEAMIGMSLESLCDVGEREKLSALLKGLAMHGRAEGFLATLTRQGDILKTKLALVKGIRKPDASEARYCFLELAEPGEEKLLMENPVSGKDNSFAPDNNVNIQVGQNEQQLQQDYNILQQAFELSPDAIYVTDLQTGIIKHVNKSFEKFSGFRKDEVIGQTIIDLNIINQEIRLPLKEKLEKTGQLMNFEIDYQRKDGTISTALVSSVILKNDSEPKVFSIARDIADRKMTERLLRSSEEKIRFISDSIPLTISYLDSDLRCQFANRLFLETFDAENKDIIGQKYADIIGHAQYENIKHHLQIALGGSRMAFEYQYGNDGAVSTYEVSFVPNISSDGTVRGVYALSDDISEKREGKLRELRLGNILENSLNEIYIFDAETFMFSHVNLGARKNLGYGMEELYKMTPLDIKKELNRQEFIEAVKPLVERRLEKLNLLTRHYRKDGSCYDVNASIQIFDIGGQKQFVAMVEDISERKKAEQDLFRAKDIILSSNDAFAYVNDQYEYVFVNQQFANLVHMDIDEIKGKTVLDIYGDKSFNRIKPFYERAFSGETVHSQLWLDYPNGKRFIDVHYKPSLDKDNNVIATVVTIRDMTELEETRQTVLENEERFRLITLSANDALYDWDIINNKVWRNDKNLSNHYSSDSMTDWYDIIHPDDRDYVRSTFKEVLDKKHSHWDGEYRLKQMDGTYLNVVDRAYILYDQENSPYRIVGAMTDISKRKEAEVALRSSEERFRTLYEDNPLMLFTLDRNGVILTINNPVNTILGYTDKFLTGAAVYSLIQAKYINAIEEALETCLSKQDVIRRIEFEIRHKWQGEIWVRSTIRAIKDETGADRILMVCEDISETRRLSQQLTYQASHDSLTGLVNRVEFERRMRRVLSILDDGSSHALCYLDLDQFKVVNDTCGHLAGDELLRQISGILKKSVRKRDTLSRLGGDEFGILMEHCTLDQAQRVANSMRKSIEEFRFIWEGKRFILGVSIGLVPIKTDSHSVNDILREADVACYAAKDAGRNRVHIYSPEDSKSTDQYGQQIQWAALINHALEEERFRLYFQTIEPITNKQSGGRKFEILLRMLGEDDKLVSPGAFMPAAERYNLSCKIDLWVFNAVTKWMLNNPSKLDAIDMCSINISGHSIADKQYHDTILQQLYETRIPPEKICFEITETVAISNMGNALKLMSTLKKVGCRFALDDFGSGVSSFGYLKQLPVDFLKIDGTFVRDIVDDPIDYEMVRSIHDIGRVMGLKTIAEFVENDEIRSKLAAIGVDYAQGYGLSRPEELI